MMKNKRASVAMAVSLLTLATLILVGISLVSFILYDNEIKDEIYVSKVIDEIYIQESQLNYVLGDIFDKVVEDFDKSQEDFINKFKIELEKYKEDGEYLIGGLNQVEEQLGNVELSQERIILVLDFRVLGNQKINDKTKINVSYEYTKELSKDF